MAKRDPDEFAPDENERRPRRWPLYLGLVAIPLAVALTTLYVLETELKRMVGILPPEEAEGESGAADGERLALGEGYFGTADAPAARLQPAGFEGAAAVDEAGRAAAGATGESGAGGRGGEEEGEEREKTYQEDLLDKAWGAGPEMVEVADAGAVTPYTGGWRDRGGGDGGGAPCRLPEGSEFGGQMLSPIDTSEAGGDARAVVTADVRGLGGCLLFTAGTTLLLDTRTGEGVRGQRRARVAPVSASRPHPAGDTVALAGTVYGADGYPGLSGRVDTYVVTKIALGALEEGVAIARDLIRAESGDGGVNVYGREATRAVNRAAREQFDRPARVVTAKGEPFTVVLSEEVAAPEFAW